MRTMFVPAVAAAALFALPALAAQSSSQSSNQTMPQTSQTKANAGQSGQGSSTQQMHAMSISQLRSSLEQAGFKNIHVLDASYLVQAQSPTGEQVVMFINPPEVGASASSAGSTGNDMTGQSTTGQSGSNKGSTTNQ